MDYRKKARKKRLSSSAKKKGPPRRQRNQRENRALRKANKAAPGRVELQKFVERYPSLAYAMDNALLLIYHRCPHLLLLFLQFVYQVTFPEGARVVYNSERQILLNAGNRKKLLSQTIGDTSVRVVDKDGNELCRSHIECET